MWVSNNCLSPLVGRVTIEVRRTHFFDCRDEKPLENMKRWGGFFLNPPLIFFNRIAFPQIALPPL
jgi:hypothetical protein